MHNVFFISLHGNAIIPSLTPPAKRAGGEWQKLCCRICKNVHVLVDVHVLVHEEEEAGSCKIE